MPLIFRPLIITIALLAKSIAIIIARTIIGVIPYILFLGFLFIMLFLGNFISAAC
jgi:hypothetical protein